MIQTELDPPLDRAGRSDEKRHACTQLEVGQTDPSPIPCQACQLCLRTNLVKDQEGEETTQEVFWSILEHMGHEEHGGTWHMEAAQLDTQRKKGEAILKTSSTLLDQPVEFLNSTGQASTRSS
ncbi:unnamed protein product [Microthlaspi erraticum]|uniref:Uncharacterized protein n=1 Tax=Microthlaspi erraticum TaxID=1685480 RepID=A0A6D2I676_9BRAS|nr:unnamed protein product [Microthlaspi erraticum]